MKTDQKVTSRGAMELGTAVLVVFLFLLANLSGAGTEQGANGFSAKMVTTIQGDTSVAHMTLKGQKMRVQVIGGRVFSTMIARYDKDLLWLIAPAARQYKEMALDTMGQGVPHFFRPDTRIDKSKVGEETVDGIKAVKYRARVSMGRGKRVYEGFLWEAIDAPGFPIKWEEPSTLTVVEWQERSFAEVPDNVFVVPTDFRKIEQPASPPPPARHQSLKAYPGKRPEPGRP